MNYEIKRSHELGKGLLGVWIQNMKDQFGQISVRGKNPIDNFYIQESGRQKYLSEIYPTYDWFLNDGYSRLPDD